MIFALNRHCEAVRPKQSRKLDRFAFARDDEGNERERPTPTPLKLYGVKPDLQIKSGM